MKNRLERILNVPSASKSGSVASKEAFVQIPGCFYKDLPTEQFEAMQQVYREAYAKAIRQQQEQHEDFDLNFGEGI